MLLAPRAGFEPATSGLEVPCSVLAELPGRAPEPTAELLSHRDPTIRACHLRTTRTARQGALVSREREGRFQIRSSFRKSRSECISKLSQGYRNDSAR